MKTIKIRYEQACETFKQKTFENLNLEKNALKPSFESLRSDEIIELILEEAYELVNALEEFEDENSTKNYHNALHEIGDLGAVGVGALAWLNKNFTSKNKD